MKKILAIIAALLLMASSAGAATLTWTDNATNERGTKVERKAVACGAAGTFTEIGEVGIDVKTYLDNTTVVGNQYCYRVRAWNTQYLDGTGNVQYSAYSNEAGIGYPLPAPSVAPSLLNVAP